MAQDKVTVTRMELLAKKQQIGLAEQGLDLLQRKRTALLRELMQSADRAMAHSDTLQAAAAAAARALGRAAAAAGMPAVRSAAMAARAQLPLEVSSINVMGVKVPRIEKKRVGRPVWGRGYAPPGVSVTIDEAAEAFEEEVNAIITLAESELRLQRLAEEFRSTSRRVNALEHLIIPRLRRERNKIEIALEERERADHFRMKRVKKLRSHSKNR